MLEHRLRCQRAGGLIGFLGSALLTPTLGRCQGLRRRRGTGRPWHGKRRASSRQTTDDTVALKYNTGHLQRQHRPPCDTNDKVADLGQLGHVVQIDPLPPQ